MFVNISIHIFILIDVHISHWCVVWEQISEKSSKAVAFSFVQITNTLGKIMNPAMG